MSTPDHRAVDEANAPAGRRPLVPAVLLMGLVNLPYGLYGALALVTAPQLLAARGVPEPQIASITAAVLIPTFAAFLLAPLLDVRFSRRSYAWVFGVVTALLAVAALVSIDRLERFTALLVLGMVCSALYNIAIGGWLGDIVPRGAEGQLAGGFQIGNVAGFGVGAIVFITLLRQLPAGVGAAGVGVAIAAPLILLVRVPPSTRDRLHLHESFALLGRDVAALVRRPVVRRALLLFVLPTCGFAMSNTLTGLGPLFHASEPFVALVAGVGVTVVGVGCGLLTPQLVKRFAPAGLFLGVGLLGAAFTLAFVVLPRSPLVLALGISGENGLQTIAFAIANAIIFRSIGDDNPLAATQYALLNAAVAFPTTYMQWVDGRAYAHGGLNAGLATDAGLAVFGVVVLAPVVLAWRRRGERAF